MAKTNKVGFDFFAYRNFHKCFCMGFKCFGACLESTIRGRLSVFLRVLLRHFSGQSFFAHLAAPKLRHELKTGEGDPW